MNQNTVTIDGIKWYIWIDNNNYRNAQPLCSKHHLRLEWLKSYSGQPSDERTRLRCEECDSLYQIPRGSKSEIQYVLNKIDAKVFANMKFINLDDEAIPIAEDKVPKNSEYFVTSLLTKSKVGLRLVVYAGKRGSLRKTQIFVEPEIRRIAFDQKDLHPTDVFTILEATFEDGSKAKLEKV